MTVAIAGKVAERPRPDAAVWNEKTQEWELGAVFDAAFCEKCDAQ
jgi:hypothetical protein